MDMNTLVAEAKEIYCNLYKKNLHLPDAFSFWMYSGDWFVYYGEEMHTGAMSRENAEAYMSIFNAPCIVCARGIFRGRVIVNPRFDEKRYGEFDSIHLKQARLNSESKVERYSA